MKKCIATLLSSLVMIMCLVLTSYAASLEQVMDSARLYSVGGYMDFLTNGSNVVKVAMTKYTGSTITGVSKEYPAYCLEPTKHDPYSAGSYSVDTKDYISNPKLYGIISNGYPYKTIGEIGVSNEDEAFYATQMAVWAYVAGWGTANWTANDPAYEDVLTAFKKIYNEGMATNEILTAKLTATPDNPKMELDSVDPNFASQTYTVTANVNIRSYEVILLDTNAPDGTQITDINNNPKTKFNAGEKFKVTIPADNISNTSGNFSLGVNGELQSNSVIYGVSYDEANQSFGIARDPFDFKDIDLTVNYSSMKTQLQIIKVAAGTNTPLSGAKFKVTDLEGGVVGVFTTDASGQVIVPLTKTGSYSVDEIVAPAGYVLSTNSHKDIVVQWEKMSTVTFTNQKQSELELQKVDADTGIGLAGAVLRVASESGLKSTDVKTDAAGFADVTGLAPGTYTVTEITAPDGYILDKIPQTVILEAGKRAVVTLKNSKKPGLVIWKYDEMTGQLLSGAEFSVAHKGGSIVYEGITKADGVIRLENLDDGWYTVTELAAPDGYLKATESKDVFLSAGKTVEIKFDNRLRPALRIVKIDEQTKQPLSGAKFKVQKTEGSTVSEYVTDSMGEITINNLDEAIYSVWEVAAPNGYVLDEQHKDIQLEWGKVKQLVFTDLKKPTLKITKYDELTNKPLAGASFRLWKTEGETWSETQVTGADGSYTWTDLDSGIYSIQEIDEPYGYFKDSARKEIKLSGGENKELEFFNRPRPVLTIFKRDAITGVPIKDVKFKVQRAEGSTIGEFLTDANGKIELSPKTGYLLEEAIYRVTEVLPPNEYLLSVNPQKDVLLKWYEPTDLIFENLLKPTLIFIKKDGMSGRGISGATYKIEYESPTGGVTNIGSYTTKCGLIVVPHVLPGWYSLTETAPASGYSLPTNPVQRVHLAPGENSYTYAQTHEDLYVDARTNPNSGNKGMCGDWCGYLCSVLCAGNCGNAGDGTMSNGSNSNGSFGNITITNGNGNVIGGNTGGATPTDTTAPVLTVGTVTRTGNYSATIQFTSSEAGKYYSAYVASGGNAPTISTLGYGTDCAAGLNTITVSLTTGAKDLYIKVKDVAGNVSNALKISVPAYSATAPTETPTVPGDTPDFSNIVITGGTVVYLNPSPEFSGIIIKFGSY